MPSISVSDAPPFACRRRCSPGRRSADGFEIASRYLPGDVGVYVGGDWFDVIETATAIVLVVGDVSGHGIDAATTMARLQTLTAAEIRAGRPIDQIFDVLDRACRDDATMATMTSP